MLVLTRACANAAQLFAGTILQILVSVMMMMMMRHNLVTQHFIFHTHIHTHTHDTHVHTDTIQSDIKE